GDLAIGRANLDGTDVNPQAFVVDEDVSSLAARANRIYFAGWDGSDEICGVLGIQPSDGSSKTGIGLDTCADFAPLDISLGPKRIFFLDASTGYGLFGANLDLSHRQKLLSGPNLAIAIPR